MWFNFSAGIPVAVSNLSSLVPFSDSRKGLCFAVVANDICEAVTKKMMQVRKKDCCCMAGKAWGINCELCPEAGTGNDVLLSCITNRQSSVN